MHVVVAGGHGQIALRLLRGLSAAGQSAVGIVRNPDHVDDVRATGAAAVVCDLEQAAVEEVATHLADADAVVFAAGAGPGSGAGRKDTVDRAASVLVADAAEQAGVRRFLQISSMGAGARRGLDADRRRRPAVLTVSLTAAPTRRHGSAGGLRSCPETGGRIEPQPPRCAVSCTGGAKCTITMAVWRMGL
ncbi:MAG: NAD(P)H-binding protein [Acidimicrobiales bacterium]